MSGGYCYSTVDHVLCYCSTCVCNPYLAPFSVYHGVLHTYLSRPMAITNEFGTNLTNIPTC